MQIDFGTMTIKIGGQPQRVHFFAAILGYSRRQYVQAFLHERQTAWFEGMEGAFRYFDGIPSEVLMDNAKAFVANHNPLTCEVVFNNRLHAFANYWNFKPKACAPTRQELKAKMKIRKIPEKKCNCRKGIRKLSRIRRAPSLMDERNFR